MKNKKNIEAFNDKGQPHGYWEVYWVYTTYKMFYLNGKINGYNECVDTNNISLIFHL